MITRLSLSFVLYVVVHVCLMDPCPVSAAQQSDDHTELLNLTRIDGVLECVIQRTDQPDVEVYGYDSRSGAWYELHAGIGWGRTASGETVVFYASDKLRNWAQSLSSSTYLEQFALPMVGLHKLLSVPAGVESVVKKPDGGFLATFVMPDFEPVRQGQAVTDELRKDWTFVYETDETGCPTRRTRVGNVADTIELTRVGKAEGGIPVCTVIPGVWSIVSGTLKPTGSRIFTASTIEQAVEFGRTAQAEARIKYAQSNPIHLPKTPQVRDDTGLTPGSSNSVFQWSLILVGTIMLISACVFWIRGRGASGVT